MNLGTLSLIVVTSLGCDMSPWEPDVGPPQQAFCVDEDGDPDNDVSYANDIVPTIFDVEPEDNPEQSFGCLRCHDPIGVTPIGFEIGGLDLTSHATLRQGGLISGSNITIPGRPCSSVLFQKLSAGAPFGTRMPFDGPPYLDDARLDLVHDWIAEGSRDN